MAGDVILEVERDPEEGWVVTLDEGADSVDVPPFCCACLGEATKRLPPKGLSWPKFPYCDACVPPVAEEKQAGRRQVRRLLPWLLGFAGIFMSEALRTSGKSVRLLLSEGGTLRLAFDNDEYARRFVEGNGGLLPSSDASPRA